jgi:hypothetical protein
MYQTIRTQHKINKQSITCTKQKIKEACLWKVPTR